MEVAIVRARNHASIRISKEARSHPERERLLIHELLHLVFDPIREAQELASAYLDSKVEKTYSEKHMQEVERAVEHMSYVLYNL